MTLARDLVWQNLELVYKSSIAHQLARYALGLSYDMLPPEVVHQAKRCLLDTLGCAIGGHGSPGRPICEDVIKEIGGREEATVFGSGLRTSALNATIVNSFMVRYLDYNDHGGGDHNSDAISAILAVSEREGVSGQDFLTALVISYEIGERLLMSLDEGFESCNTRGWTLDIRGGLNVPPALGKLMCLNEAQIANAIGACASYCLPLSILDANREEFFMSKNLRFGLVAYNAILACMLAKKGFTAPVRIVEGECGIYETLYGGAMDLERLVDFSGWYILKTIFKSLCVNATTQGYVLATIDIVKENDLKPEDIAAVKVKACQREIIHTTNLAKKYPRNGESADHSAFYGNALAIKERAFGPESFKPEKFNDPVVLDLIEKITVEVDESLPYYSLAGSSKITTKDGRIFEKHIDIPHGFGQDDPLTDSELEDKFREMAEKVMNEAQIQKIFDTVWNVDALDNMGKLTSLMVFQ